MMVRYVLAFLFSFLVPRIDAQKEAMQFQANECRHVAILARSGFNSSYTARCHIPTERFFRQSASLFNPKMIPKEWSWVFSHQGAITGQVLVRSRNTVYLISQKDCLDPGGANGRPYRSVYTEVGGNAQRFGVYGDFNFTKDGSQDGYRECVSNNAQWHSFRKWGTNQSLPSNLTQMVRTIFGGHNGTGQQLTAYNFTYDKHHLNRVFRQLVNDALYNKNVSDNDKLQIESGKPIALTTYPFETGISIIGPSSKAISGDFVRDFTQDNSNLAWNRALQAKSAFSNQENPPAPLPSELKTGELVSITALSIVAIFLFGRALEEAVRMRQAAIKDWNNPTGRWALLTCENQIENSGFLERLLAGRRRNTPKGWRAGTVDITLAFISAIVSIIAAILEFWESAHRYQKVFVVNTGGLITYGPSNSNFSIDPANPWSGAEFSVNHWLVLNISSLGRKFVEPLVYVVCALLLLYMLQAFFKYSLRREHELDFWFMRYVFRPTKWTILFCQKVFGVWLLKLFGRKQDENALILVSYENTFREVFNILADRFEYAQLDSEEQPVPRNLFAVFERLNINRFLPDRQAVAAPHMNNENGFRFMNAIGGGHVSRNEIEKCSEVLAADRFGMLGRAQSLTLMYMQGAAKAADRFINENQIPDATEIRQLALIYYVQQVIIPDGAGHRINRNEIEIINVDDVRDAGENLLNHNHIFPLDKRRKLCSVIGYRPRVADVEEAVQLMGQQANVGDVNDVEWHIGNVIFALHEPVTEDESTDDE